MTSPIDRVKTHFREQLSEDNLSGPITVAEWATDVYYKKKITLNQMSEITELAASGKTLEAVVMGIIGRALDENGVPLFKKADKITFMRQSDPDVLLRLAAEMGDVFGDLSADDLGNS
jgi:hypothetical protein